MKLRMSIMIIALAIVFGGIFGWDYFRGYMVKQYMEHFQMPPVTVSTTKAKAVTWTPTIQAIGSLMAYNGVNITPQQSGQVQEIYFHSGETVQKGQKLIGQDIATDLQDLKSYEAAYQLAKITYERQLSLYEKGHFASKQEVDQTRAQMHEALANADKTKVVISQKVIKAPFSGKIGIRQVNIGQYITPSDTLTSLQELNPLRVLFSTPEQNITALYVGQPINVASDAYPGEIFKATVTAINSEVSSATRNIQVEAKLPNPDLKLYPGMFANVEVLLPKKEKVIVVPQTAVDYSLYGNAVYRVELYTPPPQKTKMPKFLKKKMQPATDQKIYIVKRTYVTLGDQRGNEVIVLTGLKAGEEIVTSGQLKLHEGSHIIINNSVTTNTMPKTVNQES